MILDKYKTSVDDVYKYESIAELKDILIGLNNPYIGYEANRTKEVLEYINKLNKSNGLVFYWQECGDDWGDYCDYVKIIEGASL